LKPTSTNLESLPPAPTPQPVEDKPAEMPVWMQRVFVIVYVLFCIELGLVLVALPWMSDYWFSGGVLSRWPDLQRMLQSGFVRGAVSGLGLLDIWLGITEAIRYSQSTAKPQT
jgi:hypothetical protein